MQQYHTFHLLHIHVLKRYLECATLMKEWYPLTYEIGLFMQWIIENLSYFDELKTRVNKYNTSWLVLKAWIVFIVIIDALLMVLYTLSQWVSFWFVTLSFQWIKMNRIGGPWYKRRYVYEGIKQIGQDSFTYHMTLIIAKTSLVGAKLSDKKWSPLIIHLTNNVFSQMKLCGI